MPLPNPTYLTNEYYSWNGTTTSAALIETAGTTKKFVKWNELDSYCQQYFHELIMAYANKNMLTEATALTGFIGSSGWLFVDFGGTVVGANPTGLENTSRVYSMNVYVDNSLKFIDVVGSAAQTFTSLISEINTDLGASATAAIVNGNIEITSATSGNTSYVGFQQNETFPIEKDSLLKFLTGYRGMREFHGAATLNDILTRNKLFGKLFKENFLGMTYKIVSEKPPKPVGNIDKTLVYFNHNSLNWLHLYNDSAA